MITEVRERQIEVSGKRRYCAVVRDGNIAQLDSPYEGHTPCWVNGECLETYIVFLKEVLQAIEETS